jgi:protein transport protein SEC24
LFAIDVSASSVQSGLLYTAIKAVKSALLCLEAQQAPEYVGIITYDLAVHFYSFEGGVSRMRVVADVEDPFVPVAASQMFLPCRMETLAGLLGLLEHVPSMFRLSTVTHTGMGAALQMAAACMRPVGGRIIAFQSTLPNTGPGSVPPRDEATSSASSSSTGPNPLMSPQTSFYQSLGESFVLAGVSVDLFLCPLNPFIDVATLGKNMAFQGVTL